MLSIRAQGIFTPPPLATPVTSMSSATFHNMTAGGTTSSPVPSLHYISPQLSCPPFVAVSALRGLFGANRPRSPSAATLDTSMNSVWTDKLVEHAPVKQLETTSPVDLPIQMSLISPPGPVPSLDQKILQDHDRGSLLPSIGRDRNIGLGLTGLNGGSLDAHVAQFHSGSIGGQVAFRRPPRLPLHRYPRYSQSLPTVLILNKADVARLDDLAPERCAMVSEIINAQGVKDACLYIAPAVRHVLGYDPDELVGHSLAKFCHPADCVYLMPELKEASATPGPSLLITGLPSAPTSTLSAADPSSPDTSPNTEAVSGSNVEDTSASSPVWVARSSSSVGGSGTCPASSGGRSHTQEDYVVAPAPPAASSPLMGTPNEESEDRPPERKFWSLLSSNAVFSERSLWISQTVRNGDEPSTAADQRLRRLDDNETDLDRSSSWQYELQQLKFENRRLVDEVASLETGISKRYRKNQTSIAFEPSSNLSSGVAAGVSVGGTKDERRLCAPLVSVVVVQYDSVMTACDALLEHHVDMKLRGNKVTGILNRLHVAEPKPRDNVVRALFIPDAIKDRKKYDKDDSECCRLERDIEAEEGGAGVYSRELLA
ncbi:hypothetical protein BD310DRAFT_1004951, partial [Dichomitus squalens]